MRGAPPVQMACGPDARWRLSVALITATATATLLGWLLWQAGLDAPAPVLGAGVVFCVVAGVSGRSGARREPAPRLAWDGQTWTLSGAACLVDVRIDLGDWLLLRVTELPGGRVHWLPLSLASAGPSGHLARVALHARGGRPVADRP